MKHKVKHIYVFVSIVFFLLINPLQLRAQKDTVIKNSKDTAVRKRSGVIGKITDVFFTDSTSNELTVAQVVKNDKPYQPYQGRKIRNIIIERYEFGRSIRDTSEVVDNFLIRTAKKFHATTRQNVIRNNLFFKEGDRIVPYLFADNERYLRDLPYLQDARIIIKPVKGSTSVDVLVLTKDVLSIGGDVNLINSKSFELIAKEENIAGTGNSIEAGYFYDDSRRSQSSYKLGYRQRNINGTFIDLYGGIEKYNPSFSSGRREEQRIFVNAVKPLVSAYDKWTYALEFEYHHNKNQYVGDSLFKADYQFQSHNYDVWGGRLLGVTKALKNINDNRWRMFVGARILSQVFNQVPEKYSDEYYFKYADLKGGLLSFSVFKQEFYRTRYIYGFGRNEDVPEGNDISIVAGYTSKQHRRRSYLGFDFRRYYFTSDNNFIDLTIRYGSFIFENKFEDISTLVNLNYITQLRKLNHRWSQRYFFAAGLTKEFGMVLNTPLFLQSEYGLPNMSNGDIYADTRLTLKGETVFFNDKFSLAGFRFAPLAGVGMSLLTPVNEQFTKSDLFSVISAGVRVRNESLIFGTIEARASFLPRPYKQNAFIFNIRTNLQFKYNSVFTRKPDFIQVN